MNGRMQTGPREFSENHPKRKTIKAFWKSFNILIIIRKVNKRDISDKIKHFANGNLHLKRSKSQMKSMTYFLVATDTIKSDKFLF